MVDEHKNPRILIIDDDDMIRSFLRLMLASEDFDQIEEAGSGEEARKILKLRPAQIILLDINLPDADGVELLKEIRKAYPDCHVIMVSAEGTMDRVKTAISHGAEGFIVKPINAENVFNQIHSIIDKHL